MKSIAKYFINRIITILEMPTPKPLNGDFVYGKKFAIERQNINNNCTH